MLIPQLLMNVGDRVFECVRASDDRDGLSLELWEVIGEDRDGPLAEVFHTDATGAMTFTAYASDMPVEAVGWLFETCARTLAASPQRRVRHASSQGWSGFVIATEQRS